MDSKSVTLLFTSVGRRVELLRAFRAAGLEAGVVLRILACDVDPLAPALREADRAFLAPRCLEPEYGPFLADICQKEGVQAIFPLIDTELEALAGAREMIESAGARVGVPEMEVLRKTLDKQITLDLFREVGLPVPKTWFPEELDVKTLPYPVIVKPRRGSASQGVFRVENAEACRFFLGYVKEAMVQECLPGPEITTDVFLSLSGRLLGMCSRERIEVRWGEAAKAVTVSIPEVTSACKMLAEAFGRAGPFTVQCMLKDGRPYFTEINARMGGGLPLAFAAGMQGHVRLLQELVGERPDRFDPAEVLAGVYMSRFDDGIFIRERGEGVRF